MSHISIVVEWRGRMNEPMEDDIARETCADVKSILD